MKDEFLVRRPLEQEELQKSAESERYPLRRVPKTAMLREVMQQHPDGLYTYVGTLAVASKGKIYDYKGEEIVPAAPRLES